MAKVFNDVKVTWKGRDFTVPAGRVFRTIMAVEDVITIGQIADTARSGQIPYATLAQAYAIILRAAGDPYVDEEEVYTTLLGKGDGKVTVIDVVHALQVLMIPPEHMKKVVKPNG